MTEIFSGMPSVNAQYTAPVQQKTTETAESVQVKTAIPASNVAADKTDSVELSASKKEKKGPIKTIKGFIANVKKFFATTGAYAKGTAKGIMTGAVAGSVVYTGGAIINGIKTKAAQKAGEEAMQKVSKVPNKLLAGAVALIALGANIWNASLNATEANSNIDHRWTGHKQ